MKNNVQKIYLLDWQKLMKHSKIGLYLGTIVKGSYKSKPKLKICLKKWAMNLEKIYIVKKENKNGTY